MRNGRTSPTPTSTLIVVAAAVALAVTGCTSPGGGTQGGPDQGEQSG